MIFEKYYSIIISMSIFHKLKLICYVINFLLETRKFFHYRGEKCKSKEEVKNNQIKKEKKEHKNKTKQQQRRTNLHLS